MKAFLLVISLLAFNSTAMGAASWELCLDQNEYTLNANDGFLNFAKVAKLGCNLRFMMLGGKGEKLEIDLCDANIHIDQFPAIDSSEKTRHLAGAAGCPKPGFGADFNERLDELSRYSAAKARVLAILENVNKVYGKDKDKVDLSKITATSLDSSEAKTACLNHLTRQYLEECLAFEKKSDAPSTPSPLPVLPTPISNGKSDPAAAPAGSGIHPATIRK